ncbi:MAG: MBL fold metallo-hydrolase [Dehalococcoidia bacterium]|nr:MBL fold metallo-hydrolase [Dehalococcoidia bacterium]
MPRNHFKVGKLAFTVVSDGEIKLDAGATFGVVPRVLWEPHAGQLDDQHRLTMGLNCVLLQSAGNTVLIETGNGNKRGNPNEGGGELLEALVAEGVRPEDVDIVINSHLHADHCGWNTRLDGDRAVPTFPRARYIAQEKEWRDATNPNERTRATYLQDNLKPIEESGQLELVDGEKQITPEIRLLPQPGHTAGHCGILIESDGERALYLGDLVQHKMHLERFPWIASFDVLPLVALETKKEVIGRALAEKTMLIVSHQPFPGVGFMKQEGKFRVWELVQD